MARQAARSTRGRSSRRTWNRFAAPAVFLLAVTVALLLVRSALHGDDSPPAPAARTTVPVRKAKKQKTTTASATTTTTGAAKKHASRKQTSPHRTYTVQRGDSFSSIAAETGTTVTRLEQLNPGVSTYSLRVGQTIRVS